MQSKMPDCCAAANCNQNSDQSKIAFFSFPLDLERCKQWLKNCRRTDLENESAEQLHKNYRLCAKHFETSFICQHSTSQPVLKDEAVPTIFDFTTPTDNAQSSNRKRAREPAEREVTDSKKAKAIPEDQTLAEVNVEVNTEQEVKPVIVEPAHEDPVHEDPTVSKAKEILKLYFKETLAFTGFSIGNNASIGAAKPMGAGPAGQPSLHPVCEERIDPKEVLKSSENLMREEIHNSLRLERYFSILIQDATNIEGKDQIPVFIRSVTGAGFPQKHLIGFLPCDVDSDGLFHLLLSEIRNKWGLRMEHCRGLTYLTTGTICLKMSELSSRMLREFPQVVLAPSDPYAFNMWLIRSMPMLSIQNVVDTVEEVAGLLRQSSTLWQKLECKIIMLYCHIKGEVERIKEACQNHWEYGTDAFQTMLDILEPLLSCIGDMTPSSESDVDADTLAQLARLKDKLRDFNFIVTLVVLKNTLCCVSILNPSLRGAISISSTLQYTISNALKLLNKHLQEIAIFHRKWFSDAICRAKKLGIGVALPVDLSANGGDAEAQASPEDHFREVLSKKILLYLVEELKRVLSTEMVRILRWLSLVPSYMADHNFSIRKDKVADANLNNLARPDSFYDELGCWEVKWRHASKRRILPTTVFATLKIPDIGFYPNVQSLLRVLGTIPCVNAEADVYGQYDMVLDRYHSYVKETPVEERLCNMAFVYVNQDVHISVEDMVETYVEQHPDILQLLHTNEEIMEIQPSVPGDIVNDAAKEDMEETKVMTMDMEAERKGQPECSETDKEALKSALQAAITAAFSSQSSQLKSDQGAEVEYVTKSEMKEMLKVCEEAVRERILSEVGSSFFSLFIDRVVVFGEVEYLPVFLRFVDSFDAMRLELMGLVDVTLDCEAMSERLFDLVTKEWRLDLSHCRGQAYLGSGEVSYKLKAFACKVQEKYPLAICTHCSCYSFNTWWSRSIPVPAVTRALDTLEEIVLFFSSMPALEKQLDQVLAIGLRESFEKLNELQGKFCSSWLEMHDAYEVFVQMLEPLVECLERIQSNKPQRWKVAESIRAKTLLQLIRDFDFIVPMVALKNASSFTKELSGGLQKAHFSAASQLCQINGIVATLNRLKTNIKIFHQNWFDEACAYAQSLGVQIKVPDYVAVPRDGLMKPGGYYKDTLSVPLVDHLINSVKDHFSDDHKEALNFLSLVPCSVTVSYMFEMLKSKPPLYISDLPDPDNFFTELCCWRVKWKTRVVNVTTPDTIFQTLRLPVMQYFGNINTLLKIMCVLPSTAMEHCGETNRHKMFQDYLRNISSKDRCPCLAMLQVGTNFNNDLDRMVAQCLKITPKTLEGICLDKESKSFMKNAELKMEVDNHQDLGEEMEIQLSSDVTEKQQMKAVDENGHSGDNILSAERVFRQAAKLARRSCPLSDLPKEEQGVLLQELSMCHWVQQDTKPSSEVVVSAIVKATREAILSEVQESPFFSIITDRALSVADKKHIPVFVRYVSDCTPKVELIGFLPFDERADAATQAKSLSAILTEDWGLQMSCCRGQAFMAMGVESQSLRMMALNFLESYPLAVSTPSESCGLALWLAGSLQCTPISRVLGIVEDLLQFFDQTPGLESELAQTMDGLLNTPREALAEIPETCLSRWKKREDFFDLLVDMMEGILSCLHLVSTNASGLWDSSLSLHAQILSVVIRKTDFIVPLVILKNACAPLRNCSTVFRCGNPADIICELEKITPIVESLGKMLENIDAVHSPWFEEAAQLSSKLAPGPVSYLEMPSGQESPEVFYRETISVPVLNCLMDEMKLNFSDGHLKALKLLSLLPTCNPQLILSEAAEQLHTVYQSDLHEPYTAEQDINNWALAWSEKYQDVAPPASISETLLHTEAKSNANVTALLKVVAVLPSVSMECDLMKSTLNSLKSLHRSTVGRGCKMDTLMLLMHSQMFQSLEEVIYKCIESDPESQPFLTQVKERVSCLRKDSEVSMVETNGFSGTENAAVDSQPTVKPQQHPAEAAAPELKRDVLSFYDAPAREEILKELWDSQFFTIITEQEVEIEGEPYIPITIRYLDKQEDQCEETLAFVPLGKDVAAFADAMETALSEKWGLIMSCCRGVSCLNVGAVGSQMRSASKLFSQKYPQATRALSSSVSLNVWLARSSKHPVIVSNVAVVEKLLHWFTENVQRQAKLEDTVMLVYQQDEVKGNELRDKLNSNHWDRSHDMLELMMELLEVMTVCLNEMRRNPENHLERKEAKHFLSTIQNFEFVMTLVLMKNILSFTKNLSKSLQGKPLDVLQAVNSLPNLLTTLTEVQSNMDSHHQTWFQEAVALASKLQMTLLHSALLEALSVHYRDALSRGTVGHTISELRELFSDQALAALHCMEVVPYVLSKLEGSCKDAELVKIYQEDLPDLGALPGELQKWRDKWLDPLTAHLYLPSTVLDTLKASDIRSFPNIETLLRLLVVLPSSRRESTFKQGKRSLQEFSHQPKRSLSELHPL